MTRELLVLVIGMTALLLAGGCAASRVADGSHMAPNGTTGVFYDFHNARDGGGKTPLVFVHGWACDHQYWGSTIEVLPGDRPTLAVDLPGYGQTRDGGATHTMDLYAHAVLAAMDDAGIDKAVLVGHSMGTPVIRQVYRLAPDRVAGLVAVDGALRPFAPAAQMRQMVAPLFTDQWQSFSIQMFDGMASTMAHDEDRAHVREVMLGTSREAMRGGFEAMADESIWGDDAIGAPLLVVLAASPFWTDEYKAYVRGLAPGVRFVQFEGVSHFLMMDDPAGFDREVGAWLEQRGL
ncbi:MAG: alpha/beta hydrolase [Phycisphaeraceae bacterium]|nr:alpha/beta hydrolase [Phycisphaeraceae bacterium]MCB9848752.1 alpha/beta hydrolase [Phycisphaeraceae bacterium]